MSFINIKQLSKLVNSPKIEKGYEATVQLYHSKYNIKVLNEDFQTLIQTALRINKRQKAKDAKKKHDSQNYEYQIFVFGELKLFNWILVLFSHINSIDLSQYKEEHYTYIQSIFKSKTRSFIQYQITDIIQSKNKITPQWEQPQIDLLTQIIKNRQGEAEWKSISYQLFCQSQAKYFRSFTICRQKWINYLNPNIKKGQWTLAEDVDLFSLISNYGCRWALISKELKGSRSEHSIKNRYHTVVKTIKKQYRLAQSQQISSKVLKYLKLKLQKKTEKAEKLNTSRVSFGSNSSRDRSREQKKQKLDDSIQSNEKNSLFDGMYNYEPHNSKDSSEVTPSDIRDLILKDYTCEFKQEKKTNDRDQDQVDAKESLQDLLLQPRKVNDLGVKTLSLQELELQYNRLLNFNNYDSQNEWSMTSQNQYLNNYGFQTNSWALQREEKCYSWYELEE